MANNQAFKIKNGLSAKRYLQNSTAVSASDVDLSTGSYFTKTLSANTTFTFSNPPALGKAMGFSLEVTGANVTVGYDLANAAYDSKTVNLSTTAQDMHGMFFKPDGLSFYALTIKNNDSVKQYSLSTAWDISTANTTPTASFTTSSQENTGDGLFFSSDGTKMYVIGDTGDTVFEYDLTTAWDISTASYNSNSFSISTQTGAPTDLFFKPDGTKMYVSATQYIFEYDLSTAWDITTASYNQTSSAFSVLTSFTETSMFGLFFSSDGTTLFTSGITTDSVCEFSLSTAWDVSTLSNVVRYFSYSTQLLDSQAITFGNNGTKMYLTYSASGNVYQYSTSSLATATVAWPSSVKWSGATAPDAPASGEKDVYVFVTTDGGTTYYGKQAGDAVA